MSCSETPESKSGLSSQLFLIKKKINALQAAILQVLSETVDCTGRFAFRNFTATRHKAPRILFTSIYQWQQQP